MSRAGLLDATQRRQWDTSGRVVLRSALDSDHVARVEEAVQKVAAWADGDGPGLHHHEQTEHGPSLARSEDFEPHEPVLSELLRQGLIAEVLAELFGEPAALFKEKINYKQPGGAGFAPHQDATAYREGPLAAIPRHISVMIPLDAATVDNGCLFFSEVAGDEILANTAGRIDPSWVEAASWEPIEVEPGDLVFFDSYAPHYSDTNRTSHSRRAMYVTYNAASDGDHRADYYASKRRLLAEAAQRPSERVRISVNDDFLGQPVTPTT